MARSAANPSPPGSPGPLRAGHGYRNEVTWDEGRGRQPYANQGEHEAGPAGFGEAEGGSRGARSGVHQAQAERAKGVP